MNEVIENFEDIVEQNLISYVRYENNDRQNFIDNLNDEHSFPNANSIADSKILSRKKKKVYVVYEHYSLYKKFPEDKRKSRSPSKKLSENYIDFLDEELKSNLNLKNNIIVKLLKDKFKN